MTSKSLFLLMLIMLASSAIVSQMSQHAVSNASIQQSHSSDDELLKGIFLENGTTESNSSSIKVLHVSSLANVTFRTVDDRLLGHSNVLRVYGRGFQLDLVIPAENTSINGQLGLVTRTTHFLGVIEQVDSKGYVRNRIPLATTILHSLVFQGMIEFADVNDDGLFDHFYDHLVKAVNISTTHFPLHPDNITIDQINDSMMKITVPLVAKNVTFTYFGGRNNENATLPELSFRFSLAIRRVTGQEPPFFYKIRTFQGTSAAPGDTNGNGDMNSREKIEKTDPPPDLQVDQISFDWDVEVSVNGWEATASSSKLMLATRSGYSFLPFRINKQFMAALPRNAVVDIDKGEADSKKIGPLTIAPKVFRPPITAWKQLQLRLLDINLGTLNVSPTPGNGSLNDRTIFQVNRLDVVQIPLNALSTRENGHQQSHSDVQERASDTVPHFMLEGGFVYPNMGNRTDFISLQSVIYIPDPNQIPSSLPPPLVADFPLRAPIIVVASSIMGLLVIIKEFIVRRRPR